MSRRDDLEDMLADPAYFQAIFHTLSKVKELNQSRAELGLANEAIASALALNNSVLIFLSCDETDQNLALQDELYRLRSEARGAFDEAKALGARWTELQREQKEVYQVALRTILASS